MITVRKSEERGHADHGWLESFHTFSFAGYFDPRHTGFRALRVVNEDWIQGGKGFETHPHENMEIITYLVDGELEHQDSLGNGSVIRRGELQRMTAGTGVRHSESNPSQKKAHLLQIWICPERADLPPSYEQRDFAGVRKPNALVLLASQTGGQGSLTVHQDIELHGALLEAGHALEYAIDPDRHAWIQVVAGAVAVNGIRLQAGDGAAVDGESRLAIAGEADSEFLLFDLA